VRAEAAHALAAGDTAEARRLFDSQVPLSSAPTAPPRSSRRRPRDVVPMRLLDKSRMMVLHIR
jgi:hypothetical protein